MNNSKFIKIIGKVHILAGIFIAVAVIVQAIQSVRDVYPIEVHLQYALQETIQSILFQVLPLVIGGMGLISLKNYTRIFLIIYHLIIIMTSLSPIMYYGPLWSFVILQLLFSITMIICLTRPSVKQQFLSAKNDEIKKTPFLKDKIFILLSPLPILLEGLSFLLKSSFVSFVMAPFVSALLVISGIILFIKGRSYNKLPKKIALIVALVIAGLPLMYHTILYILVCIMVALHGFPHPS
jgi:hypothetical protein